MKLNYIKEGDKEYTATSLIDLILIEHHEYVRGVAQYLVELANKVRFNHVGKFPELKEIADVTAMIMADMDMHQMKEERILFPFIQAMDATCCDGGTAPESCFGDVRNPIKAMENDHEHVDMLLERLTVLTNDFQVPEGGCEKHCELFSGLRNFTENTKRHVYLENEVLFPKAVALQSR